MQQLFIALMTVLSGEASITAIKTSFLILVHFIAGREGLGSKAVMPSDRISLHKKFNFKRP
jgi:hypothetical protein